MVGRGVCFSRVENDACFLENWEPCVFQNHQILNALASFVSELNSFVAAIFSLEHFLLLSSWQVVIMESNPESETDDFLNESETDDFTLTSRKRPSIQLPVEIRKGLSPELFSTDRKALIRHMWACDESVLFKHQVTLLQLIRENLGKAFAISFEATTGAGKTASILSVAGLLASTEYKLMYVCPSEQRAVRLEVGQLLFSCTTVTSEALFVWAELRQGKLSLTYDEHAMAQVSNAQTKTDRGYGVWSRGNVGEIHCRTH